MSVTRIGTFIIGMLVVWSTAASAQRPLREGNVEALNVAPNFLAESQAELVHWSHKEERLGAKYVRLHFSDIRDQSPSNYTVVVRDRNSRAVQTFVKGEFSAKPDFWTRVIDGDYARVEVVAQMRPSGLTFKLSEIAYQQNMGAPFSITIPDEREAVFNYRSHPQLFARSRAVAKLTFIDGAFSAMCTGFLISEDRMLTNEHCINRQEVCENAVALFGYEVGENGSLSLGEQYRCAELIKFDATLDYALIRLAGNPGSVWGKLELTRRLPAQDEQAYMIQHPAGEPKQISRKGCLVTTPAADGNASGTDFGHKCDTLGGSSGSPVLGRDFAVVGLHHFGFDASDLKWREENRAVQMKRVMDHLGLP